MLARYKSYRCLLVVTKCAAIFSNTLQSQLLQKNMTWQYNSILWFQYAMIIECGKLYVRWISKFFRSEIESTLLKGHKTSCSKETRPKTRIYEHIFGYNYILWNCATLTLPLWTHVYMVVNSYRLLKTLFVKSPNPRNNLECLLIAKLVSSAVQILHYTILASYTRHTIMSTRHRQSHIPPDNKIRIKFKWREVIDNTVYEQKCINIHPRKVLL